MPSRDVPHIPIPNEYETELQAVISAMGDMQQPADRVGWEHIGTLGTGVLVSDTMMFQRFGPDASDSQLGHFYGLALPLLMRGLPVEPVQIETAQLDRYKTLLLSYEGQKPPKPEFHDALAAWVKAGGALIVVDNDRDPFNNVREWWNTGDMHYATPRHHLFDKLGIDHDATGQHQVGQGIVTFVNRSPSGLSRKRDGAEQVERTVQDAMARTGQTWKESSAMVLRRGPYIVAAGLDLAADTKPITLKGRFIPLFDADQPVVHEYSDRARSTRLARGSGSLSKRLRRRGRRRLPCDESEGRRRIHHIRHRRPGPDQRRREHAAAASAQGCNRQRQAFGSQCDGLPRRRLSHAFSEYRRDLQRLRLAVI